MPPPSAEAQSGTCLGRTSSRTRLLTKIAPPIAEVIGTGQLSQMALRRICHAQVEQALKTPDELVFGRQQPGLPHPGQCAPHRSTITREETVGASVVGARPMPPVQPSGGN